MPSGALEQSSKTCMHDMSHIFQQGQGLKFDFVYQSSSECEKALCFHAFQMLPVL